MTSSVVHICGIRKTRSLMSGITDIDVS